MNEPRFTIEEVTDPDEVARCKARHAQAVRNLEWLEAHWGELLPHVRGKHLAVAGQEAFWADTPEEVIAWVDSKHPDDKGALVQYIFPSTGPRIYENRR